MELGYLFLRFLVTCLKWTTFPFRKIYFSIFNTRIPIPPAEDPILFYSATKLAKLIREKQTYNVSRKLTSTSGQSEVIFWFKYFIVVIADGNIPIKSETIIKTYISRINSVNGILNAVVEDRYLDAIEEAKQVDILLNQPNIDIEKFAIQKPLLGVPVTIKESCAMKDLSLSVGFTFMKGTKAKEDGAAVSKLRKAGAIPLLVSTTSELCLSISCETLINGTTRNPYNTNCTSGGSSGGEGALIGSGSSLIGIGSDLGGSVRIPAMFNCIFGHKPTARLIPCEGHWPTCHDLKFYDYITIGPLARYAGDLKLMMKILSVSDKVNFDEEVNLKDINIFFTEDIGFFLGSNSVQVEIKQAVRDAVNYLHETYNMHISNEKIDKFDTVGESFISELLGIDDIIRPLQDPNNPDVKYTMMGQLVKGVFSKPNITMTNVLADVFIIRGNGFIPKSHTEKHRLNMEQLRDKMIHFLQKNGILIMPTFPTSAFHSVEIAWHMINASVFTGILNILGFPSTQVPMGFDRKGMPIGVQVISAPYQDNLCLTVAEILEKQFKGWQPPFKPTYK